MEEKNPKKLLFGVMKKGSPVYLSGCFRLFLRNYASFIFKIVLKDNG
jgi:hypothetical protein